MIYQSRLRSYRDLPLRLGEIGVVHRFEASGELHGIIRPREFTQDDAHIFCRPDQVEEEIEKVINLCFYFYKAYGLELDHLELSTRPEKSIGADAVWEKAEKIMKEVLVKSRRPYQVNPGEGAFYGPKIDFHLRDSLGRTWQCSTIQLDFAQPENFNLFYIDEQGKKKRPVMIHRVIYGSLERFLGILIESCGGAFPLWLSPIQVKIIPISDKELSYSRNVFEKLRENNLRVELDDRSQTASAKIRQAQEEKIPYMVIIGQKEEKNQTINIRTREGKILGEKKLEEWARSIAPLAKMPPLC